MLRAVGRLAARLALPLLLPRLPAAVLRIFAANVPLGLASPKLVPVPLGAESLYAHGALRSALAARPLPPCDPPGRCVPHPSFSGPPAALPDPRRGLATPTAGVGRVVSELPPVLRVLWQLFSLCVPPCLAVWWVTAGPSPTRLAWVRFRISPPPIRVERRTRALRQLQASHRPASGKGFGEGNPIPPPSNDISLQLERGGVPLFQLGFAR